MKFYHNPRCSKSREALQLLQQKGVEPAVVLYMSEPLLPDDLSDLLEKLKMTPQELLRKNEKIWKEEFADMELSPEEIILCMIEHPQLMERPILEKGDKAVVARPPERVLELI